MTSQKYIIISSRANKLLGYLKRNTMFILRTEVRRTLYLALVRPLLGYATQSWAPQCIELIVKFERIQRRATKFILKLPYSSNISYKSRLQTLNLIPICYWHVLLYLTFFFQFWYTVLLTWTPLSYLKFANTVDALDPQPAMLINT